MRNFNKLISVFLAFAMLLSLSMPVMASETDNGIPANATRHTIEVTLEPGEDLANGEDDGVAPYIWGQQTHNNIGTGTTTYTAQMNIPDRYFAFETYALDANGNATSGTYYIRLVYQVTSSIAGKTCEANGTVYKLDWIDIDLPGNGYHFAISNNTSTTITVYITYYSWA